MDSALPLWIRLEDDALKAKLTQLRSAAALLLAGNYLPHFTDHSVAHSDRLCALVDQLTCPLNLSDQLAPTEAFILYASCYLHDIGLQHQKAGDTDVIQQVMREPRFSERQWHDLEESTRRSIVRDTHNRISEEMVRKSVDAQHPVLGIQLTQEWNPGPIACLCAAHTLDAGGDDYRQLTALNGTIRMDLLSALLRVADILDESRGRSCLHLEQTRELDLESRMHWWRHYYVSDIAIDSKLHRITVWFDFPPDHRARYKDLFETMQIPWIRGEFQKHEPVFAPLGLLWQVRIAETPAPQSTTRALDAELEAYIARRFADRQRQQANMEQVSILEQLETSRPVIERAIEELHDRSAKLLSNDEMLLSARRLSEQLWDLRGRRTAWITLYNEYRTRESSVSSSVRFETAIRLAEMMAEDEAVEEAHQVLQGVTQYADSLPDQSPLKFAFYRLFGRVNSSLCAFDAAYQAMQRAVSLAPNREESLAIEAEILEMHFLLGRVEISSGANSPGRGE